MTVAEIQSVVAAYLQKGVDKFDVSGTTANLILLAMNNARKYAERRHNWSVCRKKGYFSVTTGNRVAWDSPVWFDGGTEKMKEGKHWWLRADTADTTSESNRQDRPVKSLGQGVKQKLELQQDYVPWGIEGTQYRRDRYLNETSLGHPLLSQEHVVTRGKWLELYPVPTETKMLVVDGYVWWPDWSADLKASVTIKTQTAGTGPNWFSWSTLEDGDLMFLRVVQDGLGTSDQQFEFDDDASTTPGNVAISLPATLANIVTAINTAYSADIATTDGTSLTLTTEIAGDDTIVYANFYQTASARFVVSVEGTGNAGASDSDWWTENASEFLILRSVVEANRLTQIFTGNKEGNLAPPEKQAEQALQVLIDQDIQSELAGESVEYY